MDLKYSGLTQREAREKLSLHGENKIRTKKKNGALSILAGQFQDALIIILLGATLLSLAMGEYVEAITISAIVVLNALLGFIQEFRAEKTLEKLGSLTAPVATVMRDGEKQRIEASALVPDDLIFIEAGDRIPADCDILSATGLTCDESMLSGESAGVEKHIGDKIYMGTTVTRGMASARIIETGDATEMGKIANMIDAIEVNATPLQKRLSQLSKYIGIACLVICAIVAGCGIARGEDVFDMLLCGISLSVAAVPEGLPAIVTIALALSVNRMVKRRALVKRLHAVETLGSADVICSDKTGTLTENRMTVKQVSLPDEVFDISGIGYSLDGKFTSRDVAVTVCEKPALNELVTCAALCNHASITRLRKNKVRVFGEATEIALLVLAAKANVTREKLPHKIIAEIPFDSTRKMMSVLTDGKLYCKGAPDILLSKCTHIRTRSGIRPMTSDMRRKIISQNDLMAQNALRVLAFASRDTNELKEENLTFLGLAGLLDPPRREAKDAVAKCRSAGIRPIMITGDHAITARAIAKELRIYTEGDRVLCGKELDALDDTELSRLLPTVSVFARVTPEHKLRIVKALKAHNHIVAMTGDGVNDAPAIKEADIGVSMGQTGTDVTKEAASVILLDDNFATLVSAVEEGRVIYHNIRKFIRYLLSCNIGEVITMFLAMLLGLPIPLIPIQILLINLITDGLPAIALSLDPADPDVMARPPRSSDESVFSNGLAITIIVRGLLIGFTTLAAFYLLYRVSGDILCARTGALLTLVLTQLIHVFECKSETRGLLTIPIFNNKSLLLAVLASLIFMYLVIYTPFFSAVFNTVALAEDQLLLVLALTFIVPIISSIFLYIKRKLIK